MRKPRLRATNRTRAALWLPVISALSIGAGGCRDGQAEQTVQNLSDPQLSDRMARELQEARPANFREAFEAVAFSNTAQEIRRRQDKREAAALAEAKERHRREAIQQAAAEQEEAEKVREAEARLERAAAEALHPKLTPPSPQEQADIAELDRLAGRK